jgi:HlyD family secretion protein
MNDKCRVSNSSFAFEGGLWVNKKIIMALVLVMLLAASCAVPGPAATPAATGIVPTPIAPGANGKLSPRQFIELSVKSSGVVAEMLVSEGDQVKSGQALAHLDDTLLKLAVQDARLKLKQAELDLEKANKPADPADLAAAEKAIQAAQTALNNVQGATSTTVNTAQIALRNAQLVFDQAERDYHHELDRQKWGLDVNKDLSLRTSQVRYENARADLEIARRDAASANARVSESILAAQKALASAQADYAALKRRPEPEQVKAAQLTVETAKLALTQAEADLQDATLIAPIGGMVAEVSLKVGQQASPGAPAITLADTSAWCVETDNLTELSVVGVKEGSQVAVKFDATPGLSLPGHVERIALRGQDQRGDVLYTVRVALDNMDPRLRWGMTAFVQFEK